MTQKQIKETVVSVSPDGTLALCYRTSKGELKPVRTITPAEITSALALMYATHITADPKHPVMILPLDNEGKALAVCFAQQ